MKGDERGKHFIHANSKNIFFEKMQHYVSS